MANEIYSTTRDVLAVLVSRQAADGILRRALEAHASDADRVDVPLMSRLLRGDVRRTLERSLPRRAVRPQLAELDARLAALTVRPTWDDEPDEPDKLDELDVPALASTEPPAVAPAAVAPAAVAPAAVPTPTSRSRSPTQGRSSEGPDLPPGPLLDRLGDQDALRQWAWWPDLGTPVGRGAGPPPDRTRRLLAPLLTALDRDGAVRSIHVDHGQGHVLIGRTPGATLTVTGDPDLNLGAIYAAFRALEEEP